MIRTYDEEMIYRTEQRRRYFENPKYRKWSDVVTKCLDEASDGNDYAEIRDDVFFSYYLADGPLDEYDSTIVLELLDVGRTLPIDWFAFYSYFEERMNDPHNRYFGDFTTGCYGTGTSLNSKWVPRLLDNYRQKLLPASYDMI